MTKTDKPTPPALNLDTLERDDAPEPFTFVLRGETITLIDPMEVNWRTLVVAMGDPQQFLKLVVPEDHHDVFFSGELATWKMRKLMDGYAAHYELGDVALPT